MISEQEQEKIRFLSDTELYPQAVEFMRGVGRTLPQTQINGLLNVSLASTYNQLQEFIEHQRARKTWKRGDEHIPDFYRRLAGKLKDLERSAMSLLRARQAPREDVQTFTMLLAHEFIQHVLAENAYMEALRAFQKAERNEPSNQGGFQRNNQGPMTRQQGRA